MNVEEAGYSGVPSGTELVRPFLPSRDIELSTKFYEAVGFHKLLHAGDVAIFRAGSGGFILQRRYQKDWAENCMMQLMVDDLDRWWAHILSLDLLFSRRRLPQFSPGGFESRTSSILAECCGMWHNGALA